MTQKEMLNRVWDAIFGNGHKGVKANIIALKLQVKFIMAMNVGIIGLLIKIIFFQG